MLSAEFSQKKVAGLKAASGSQNRRLILNRSGSAAVRLSRFSGRLELTFVLIVFLAAVSWLSTFTPNLSTF